MQMNNQISSRQGGSGCYKHERVVVKVPASLALACLKIVENAICWQFEIYLHRDLWEDFHECSVHIQWFFN